MCLSKASFWYFWTLHELIKREVAEKKKNVAKTNQHYLDKYRQNKAVEVNY